MGAQAITGGITGGIGAGLGIYQAIKGAKESRDAKNAMDNYERQNLENIHDNTRVSTLGADRQLAEQARLASGQISALQGAGTRGLIGGLGRVEVGNQNVNQQVTANLDEQQKQIDFARAEDQARIRSMQENRENADLSALSSQYQSGKQDLNTGLGTAVMGLGMAGNSVARGLSNKKGVANTPLVNNLPQSGYQNNPILSNPMYNPMNFGTQNNVYQQPIGQFGTLGNGMFKNYNPYV